MPKAKNSAAPSVVPEKFQCGDRVTCSRGSQAEVIEQHDSGVMVQQGHDGNVRFLRNGEFARFTLDEPWRQKK